MLTGLSWRAAAAFAALQVTLSSLIAPRRERLTPLVRSTGLVGARGVTFIEYALLAAIAVFIAWLFRSQLSEIFDSMLGKLNDGINDSASTGR